MKLYKFVVKLQQYLVARIVYMGFHIAFGGVYAYYPSVVLSLIRSK